MKLTKEDREAVEQMVRQQLERGSLDAALVVALQDVASELWKLRQAIERRGQ